MRMLKSSGTRIEIGVLPKDAGNQPASPRRTRDYDQPMQRVDTDPDDYDVCSMCTNLSLVLDQHRYTVVLVRPKDVDPWGFETNKEFVSCHAVRRVVDCLPGSVAYKAGTPLASCAPFVWHFGAPRECVRACVRVCVCVRASQRSKASRGPTKASTAAL